MSETFTASIVGGVLEYATKIVPKIDDGMTLAERRDSWMEADQPAVVTGYEARRDSQTAPPPMMMAPIAGSISQTKARSHLIVASLPRA